MYGKNPKTIVKIRFITEPRFGFFMYSKNPIRIFYIQKKSDSDFLHMDKIQKTRYQSKDIEKIRFVVFIYIAQCLSQSKRGQITSQVTETSKLRQSRIQVILSVSKPYLGNTVCIQLIQSISRPYLDNTVCIYEMQSISRPHAGNKSVYRYYSQYTQIRLRYRLHYLGTAFIHTLLPRNGLYNLDTVQLETVSPKYALCYLDTTQIGTKLPRYGLYYLDTVQIDKDCIIQLQPRYGICYLDTDCISLIRPRYRLYYQDSAQIWTMLPR